jgi:hypothetical protein
MTFDELPGYLNYIALALVIALAIVFVIFTFNPPDLPIFFDSEAGIYGIP